jgi:hypothetical protein
VAVAARYDDMDVRALTVRPGQKPEDVKVVVELTA